MRQQRRRQINQTHLILEQIALLFTSFVWTTVILSVIVMVWALQDIQSTWNLILDIPATPTPETELVMYLAPTRTPWPGPPPSPTPTQTLIPTATATRVVAPPNILPDTPNQDDPTPAPVLIHADESLLPTATNTPAPAISPTPEKPSLAPTDNSKKINQPQTATPTTTATPVPTANEPTRLVISSVGIDATVTPVGWDVVEQNGQEFSVWHVADYAVGWHKTTALPGQPGNTVLAGHHNIKGEVFRDLVNVEVGDTVLLYVGDTAFTYTVELKTIVKEKGEPLEVRQKNAEWIAPTTDERLTMVTCWPYTNNTHRVIVVAKPSG